MTRIKNMLEKKESNNYIISSLTVTESMCAISTRKTHTQVDKYKRNCRK